MTELVLFKETFANHLRASVEDNLQKYLEDEPWTSNIGTKSQRELPTGTEISKPISLSMPDGDNLKDLENAIQLYQSLPNLTPLQARDPRLWTRLTHVELWPYMRKRWPIEKYMDGGNKKAAGRVLERYFVPQSQSRALMRNGAARLWWATKMSYDASRENPFELTGVLLSKLDITQQLLERGMGRAGEVVHGFLEFLHRNDEAFSKGGNEIRDTIRTLAKYMNMRGGVCILDSLSQTEIISLLEGEYENLVRKEA